MQGWSVAELPFQADPGVELWAFHPPASSCHFPTTGRKYKQGADSWEDLRPGLRMGLVGSVLARVPSNFPCPSHFHSGYLSGACWAGDRAVLGFLPGQQPPVWLCINQFSSLDLSLLICKAG